MANNNQGGTLFTPAQPPASFLRGQPRLFTPYEQKTYSGGVPASFDQNRYGRGGGGSGSAVPASFVDETAYRREVKRQIDAEYAQAKATQIAEIERRYNADLEAARVSKREFGIVSDVLGAPSVAGREAGAKLRAFSTGRQSVFDAVGRDVYDVAARRGYQAVSSESGIGEQLFYSLPLTSVVREKEFYGAVFQTLQEKGYGPNMAAQLADDITKVELGGGQLGEFLVTATVAAGSGRVAGSIIKVGAKQVAGMTAKQAGGFAIKQAAKAGIIGLGEGITTDVQQYTVRGEAQSYDPILGGPARVGYAPERAVSAGLSSFGTSFGFSALPLRQAAKQAAGAPVSRKLNIGSSASLIGGGAIDPVEVIAENFDERLIQRGFKSKSFTAVPSFSSMTGTNQNVFGGSRSSSSSSKTGTQTSTKTREPRGRGTQQPTSSIDPIIGTDTSVFGGGGRSSSASSDSFTQQPTDTQTSTATQTGTYTATRTPTPTPILPSGLPFPLPFIGVGAGGSGSGGRVAPSRFVRELDVVFGSALSMRHLPKVSKHTSKRKQTRKNHPEDIMFGGFFR